MRRQTIARTLVALVSLLLVATGGACASGPPGAATAPGTGDVFGSLRVVPHEGVTATPHASSSYGNRRMRDVELVDYSSPGFAVVFADAPRPPGGQVEIAIRSSRITRLEPEYAAVGAGGRVSITNATSQPCVLSYPAAGTMRRLAPGERIDLDVARAGEQGLFLLGVPGATTTLFAAPGPWAVTSSTGRFELKGLAPGHHELHAWHPRFPPATRSVDLASGARVQVDFEIGVGRGDTEASEAGAEAHTHGH